MALQLVSARQIHRSGGYLYAPAKSGLVDQFGNPLYERKAIIPHGSPGNSIWRQGPRPTQVLQGSRTSVPGLGWPYEVYGGANLHMWFRADADNVVVDGSTNTEEWLDGSENQYDTAQGTSSERPAWTASNAKFNGHPTVDFDGSGQDLPFVNTSIVQPNLMTVLVVARNTYVLAGNKYNFILHRKGSAAVDRPQFCLSMRDSAGGGGANQMGIYDGTDSQQAVHSVVNDLSLATYFEFKFNQTGPVRKVRFADSGFTQSTESNNTGSAAASGQWDFLGFKTTFSTVVPTTAEIAEIVIATVDDTAADALALDHLNDYYDLGITP